MDVEVLERNCQKMKNIGGWMDGWNDLQKLAQLD